MLGRVVQRFEAGEVHGRLDLDRVAADTVVLDGDAHRRVRLLAAQRRRQPVRGEHRRVDALRQITQASRAPPAMIPRRSSAIRRARSASRRDERARRREAAPSARRGTAARRRGCRARPAVARRPARRRSARRDARISAACSEIASRRSASSAVRRTLRNTSPACEAKSCSSRRSAGESGSLGDCVR